MDDLSFVQSTISASAMERLLGKRGAPDVGQPNKKGAGSEDDGASEIEDGRRL